LTRRRRSSTNRTFTYLERPIISDMASTLRSDGVRTYRRPQPIDGTAIRERILSQATSAEERIPGLLEQIRQRASEADPLAVYSQLQVLDAMRRNVSAGPVGFGSDAMVEFLGGIVTALPVEFVSERIGAKYHPQVLFDLDALLREYGTAEYLAQFGRRIREEATDRLAVIQSHLEFEYRFDRMQGYQTHLRAILDAVLRPLSEPSRLALGFRLDSVISLVDVYSAIRESDFRAASEALDAAFAALPRPGDREEAVQQMATHAAGLMTFGAAPIEDDLPALLAEHAHIPVTETKELLGTLSTPLGSQSAFQRLGDNNTLRRKPIIQLPDGRLMWTRPADFLHNVLDWAADVCEPNGDLAGRFDRQRQTTCEELTATTLAGVFGDARVLRRATYPAGDQWPDIDVLVTLPDAAVVVEAKGGRFTDPARRGAPGRVKTKAREFVDKSVSQTARASLYLLGNSVVLRDYSGRPIDFDRITDAVSIVVTLERVDPFATYIPDAGRRETYARENAIWLISLADLLLVAEVLSSPAEFYTYARTRSDINAAGAPLVFVEADALETWCYHRIQPVRLQQGEAALLLGGCERLNDHYTLLALNNDQNPAPPRPDSNVPTEVLDALNAALASRPSVWRQLAIATMSIAPTEWRRIARLIKGMKRAQRVRGRSARRSLRAAAEGVRLADDLMIQIVSDRAPNDAEVDERTLRVIVPL
jgi:hypothetical protein